MNTLEKKEALKFSKVLRASRKMKGVGQQDLAAAMGISQSLLSKLENALIIPSAPTWFYLCEFLEVQTDSGVKGFIDRRRDSTLSDIDRLGNFKIPKNYSYLQGSMTRTSRPLLHYFAKHLGEKKTKEYLKHKEIDPDFFVILDNPLNINFNLELLRTMINSGHLKKNDIPELTSFMKDSLMHGSLEKDYETQKDAKTLLGAFEKNLAKYETNWRYHFDLNKKDKVEIECLPQPHLNEFDLKSDSIDKFISDYRKNFIKEFLTEHKIKTKQIESLSSIYEGKEKCVYQIQLAQ